MIDYERLNLETNKLGNLAADLLAKQKALTVANAALEDAQKAVTAAQTAASSASDQYKRELDFLGAIYSGTDSPASPAPADPSPATPPSPSPIAPLSA